MRGSEIETIGFISSRVKDGGTIKYNTQAGPETSSGSEMPPSAHALRAWSPAHGVQREILKWGLGGRKLGHWGISLSWRPARQGCTVRPREEEEEKEEGEIVFKIIELLKMKKVWIKRSILVRK